MYSTLSQKNVLNIIPIAPNRGLIYDRNGVMLAQNIAVFSLNIIPAKVKSIKNTLQALKKIIAIFPHDIKNFNRSLKQHHPFDPVPLKINLSEQELAKFYVNRYRFPGVVIQSKMLRKYPLGEEVSQIVGYVGRINANDLSKVNQVDYSASNYIGKTGIEKYYEDSLHGRVGVEEVEMNAAGRIVRHMKRTLPQPGNDLYLTIDSRLQSFCEKVLGADNGAIVIIQPSTGQILALVSTPSYDPNLFINGISHKDYETLLKSPGHPLFNRAIRGQYAPGSTIKPFIAIAGLDSGAITADSKIYDPGWFRLPETKHVYHDWKPYGHGWVNVTKAMIVSCDTFFYRLAVTLGMNVIDQMLSRFGFGNDTKIDMPEALSGLLPSPEWKRNTLGHSWYTGDTILTGIGQGYLLVTPLQLAIGAAIIAQRGAYFQPHLLLKFQRPDETVMAIPNIEEIPIVLQHPQVWDIVIHAMQGVITHSQGTAVGFGRHPPYTVAGKTGTAQVFGKQRDEERSRMNIPKKLRNNHLFIGFLPVNQPKIVMAVVVEHASAADSLARRISDFYLKNCSQQDDPK